MQLCCKEFGSKIKELLFDFFEVFRRPFCGGLGTCVMFFHGFTRIFKFVDVFAQLAANNKYPSMLWQRNNAFMFSFHLLAFSKCNL